MGDIIVAWFPIGRLRVSRKYPSHRSKSDFTQESLRLLVQSLKENGFSADCPISAFIDRRGMLIVVHGYRRLKAAKIVGIEKIPVRIVKEPASPEEHALTCERIETIQRPGPVTLDEKRQVCDALIANGATLRDIRKLYPELRRFYPNIREVHPSVKDH